ncbi:hypothetical protein PALB_30690 [Pseudoalteromonas luteoviolacea B = ATCC 29581]|nr:hypothetical protein PALB_30690 [Pseudoalteromonas luteoviolacea B = ATCC 29581]
MPTLIVSDIFGNTLDLQEFAVSLTTKTRICSPYSFELPCDSNEDEVYKLFLDECGHDQFKELVKEMIIHFQPSQIIAFSAGAVASWRALAEMPLKRVERFIGFYPSQIRNFLSLKPGCKTDLYFAYQENHFDVTSCIKYLNHIHNVSCYRTRYAHGFMNRRSRGFNLDAYDHYVKKCNKANFNSALTTEQHHEVVA